MSDKYVVYPEYKDSGIRWLGRVPEDWVVTAVKRFARFTTGWTPPTGNEAYFGGNHLWANISDLGPRVLNSTAKTITDAGVRATRLNKSARGSLLFSFKLSIGQVSIVGDEMYTNEAIATFPPSDTVYIPYMYWAAPLFIPMNAEENIYGAKLLNQERIANAGFVLPSAGEQRTIAAFLDDETARIDQLIAKQQRLIELLKEKRQAVISHAVTKGLNPNAPMKDSGVEWLGQVPEHWVVTKAKYVSQVFIPQRNKPELNESQGYPWVTMEDMTNQYIVNPSRFVSSEAMKLAGSRLLPSGSVIASCVGNLGVASINTQDVIINQQLQAFIPISIKAEYLKHIVRVSKPYFELIGTAATLVYVNQEGFENMPMLVPSAEEQEKICHFVFDKDIKFMTLIAKAEHKVKLLLERRTALISAAVTGKIDLRGWNPPNERNSV